MVSPLLNKDPRTTLFQFFQLCPLGPECPRAKRAEEPQCPPERVNSALADVPKRQRGPQCSAHDEEKGHRRDFLLAQEWVASVE